MNPSRRSFLKTVAATPVVIAAPAVITTPGLLMPVRLFSFPDWDNVVISNGKWTLDFWYKGATWRERSKFLAAPLENLKPTVFGLPIDSHKLRGPYTVSLKPVSTTNFALQTATGISGPILIG